MHMHWFRFYSEALDNPKVQRLPGDLFKGWVNLLCLASEGEPRGSLPSLEDIAFRLRLSDGDAQTLLDALLCRGLLDADDETGALRPHSWDERQPPSDRDATNAERQKRYRQQHPAKPENRNALRNGSVTRLEKNREEKNKRREDHAPAGEEMPTAERDTPARVAAGANDDVQAKSTPRVCDPYDLYTVLCEELSAPPEAPPPPRQMGIAKRLSRRYDAEDVRACLRYLVSQHWRTGALDLGSVESQIEAWILAGRPESEPPPRQRPRPVPNPDGEFDYAANLRWLSGERGARA